MRFWIIISLLFSLANSQAQELNLSELRELYIEASFEEDKANKLYELTKNSSIESDYKNFARVKNREGLHILELTRI